MLCYKNPWKHVEEECGSAFVYRVHEDFFLERNNLGLCKTRVNRHDVALCTYIMPIHSCLEQAKVIALTYKSEQALCILHMCILHRLPYRQVRYHRI